MKWKKYLLTALLLIVSGLLVLSAVAEERQATAVEKSQQKEQYEKSMEERLRKLGKQLDELKSKAATMAERMKKDTKEDLNAAEKKRKIASQKLEQMRNETEEKWKKFSKKMNEAVYDFEKAYKKAKSHFKE